MSISSILTSLESQVSTTLGSTWSELEYIYDLEANSFRNSDSRYGIGAVSGSSVPGTNKAITVGMGFFVVLTKTFVNKSSDENQRTIISNIYDEFETLNVNIFQKKLSNASVLLVSELSYNEPEVVGEKTLSIRVDFIVKFRNQTN